MPSFFFEGNCAYFYYFSKQSAELGAGDIWLQKEHLLIFLARFVLSAHFMLRCCYDSKIRLAIWMHYSKICKLRGKTTFLSLRKEKCRCADVLGWFWASFRSHQLQFVCQTSVSFSDMKTCFLEGKKLLSFNEWA